MKNIRPAAEEAFEWLREAAQPPPGVELISADGSSFTGLVLVERNRPVAMLALRHPPARSSPSYSSSHHSSSSHSPYVQRRLFGQDEDDEEPPWRSPWLQDR